MSCLLAIKKAHSKRDKRDRNFFAFIDWVQRKQTELGLLLTNVINENEREAKPVSDFTFLEINP